MLNFSIFDGKYTFWTNLVQKAKLSAEAWIWYLVYSNMQNSMVMFSFMISAGNTLFGQSWSENCLFNVKFGTKFETSLEYTEFNGGFHFLHFQSEILFLGKFDP